MGLRVRLLLRLPPPGRAGRAVRQHRPGRGLPVLLGAAPPPRRPVHRPPRGQVRNSSAHAAPCEHGAGLRSMESAAGEHLRPGLFGLLPGLRVVPAPLPALAASHRKRHLRVHLHEISAPALPRSDRPPSGRDRESLVHGRCARLRSAGRAEGAARSAAAQGTPGLPTAAIHRGHDPRAREMASEGRALGLAHRTAAAAAHAAVQPERGDPPHSPRARARCPRP
mmetsp:Transcript_48067/g.143517  ORF Transcript_48067/g.143517 Transcript_48067/m.143517 type:complete len:224 (+) Transcript_48067:1183-1854(+)